MTDLCDHVGHVLSVGAFDQVTRVDAWRVVAAVPQVIGPAPGPEHEGNARCVVRLGPCSEEGVRVWLAALPRPTVVRGANFDMRPESLRERPLRSPAHCFSSRCLSAIVAGSGSVSGMSVMSGSTSGTVDGISSERSGGSGGSGSVTSIRWFTQCDGDW